VFHIEKLLKWLQKELQKYLATIVIKLTNSSSNIIYKDLPEDDPKKRRPDITLASTKLDWKPIIDLETGLQKTINYFNHH